MCSGCARAEGEVEQCGGGAVAVGGVSGWFEVGWEGRGWGFGIVGLGTHEVRRVATRCSTLGPESGREEKAEKGGGSDLAIPRGRAGGGM